MNTKNTNIPSALPDGFKEKGVSGTDDSIVVPEGVSQGKQEGEYSFEYDEYRAIQIAAETLDGLGHGISTNEFSELKEAGLSLAEILELVHNKTMEALELKKLGTQREALAHEKNRLAFEQEKLRLEAQRMEEARITAIRGMSFEEQRANWLKKDLVGPPFYGCTFTFNEMNLNALLYAAAEENSLEDALEWLWVISPLTDDVAAKTYAPVIQIKEAIGLTPKTKVPLPKSQNTQPYDKDETIRILVEAWKRKQKDKS